MLTSLGRFVFTVGLGSALVSYVVTALLLAAGIPPPKPIAEASGIVKAMEGLGLGAAMDIFTKATAGVALLGVFVALFRGRQIGFEVGRVMALTAYTTLFTIAADGVAIVLRSAARLWMLATPPLAGASAAVVTTLYLVSLTALGYYLLVRVFGVPAE